MPRARKPALARDEQEWGDVTAREESLAVVPMAQSPALAPVPVVAPDVPITPLDAPTERPNEPLTAGLPVGPGPGPEVIGLDVDDDLVATLRAIHAKWPSPDILDLIAFEQERRL